MPNDTASLPRKLWAHKANKITLQREGQLPTNISMHCVLFTESKYVHGQFPSLLRFSNYIFSIREHNTARHLEHVTITAVI